MNHTEDKIHNTNEPKPVYRPEFGEMVFNDSAMKTYLPQGVYQHLKDTREKGLPLPAELANEVASGMLDWALHQGATHYTHWFQPMTGVTAEKHDAFLELGNEGKAISRFHGRELIRGEPDASSFPSGGLRSIFEARGYTAWDPSSFAFVKDKTLYIPTAFCSFSGHAMDKKTPLLRSMQALNKQALRILRIFGDETSQVVYSTAGIEQEYFLIDETFYRQRPDLINCSRTLFGARAAKGQELNDHYFGSLKPRVAAFMQELDQTLWRLGVPAKTKHNEVAPSQHELAPIFATANVACDQNQLTMEVMKSIAAKHRLVCLLHEKPYAGLNGSGKHNNWSLMTDEGKNLLKPGDTPEQNLIFLLLLTALIAGVDEYQGLLRISAEGASNDQRLGEKEAPPAIISIYIGERLTELLDMVSKSMEIHKLDPVTMETGVTILPRFDRDLTDRNRTSPFAFNGDRFEFRMLGSSASAACPNMILNTIVADTLERYADELEKTGRAGLTPLLARELKQHRRIIFNGNAYTAEWREEAARRGLTNWATSAEALPHYSDEPYVRLFERQRVLDRAELEMRQTVLLENYCATIQIEAFTMLEMTHRGILPQAIRHQKELAETVLLKREVLGESYNSSEPGAAMRGYDGTDAAEVHLLKRISSLTDNVSRTAQRLRAELQQVPKDDAWIEAAKYYQTVILPTMHDLRSAADLIEQQQDEATSPYPSYQTMIYSDGFRSLEH